MTRKNYFRVKNENKKKENIQARIFYFTNKLYFFTQKIDINVWK